jgi:hypothetical protein
LQTRIEAGKGCVEFGARRIEYVLYRGARKNLRFVVGPDLSVSVYAPERAGAQQIAEAIAKKARWMAKALDKVAAYHPLPAPKHYVSGETFVYLGRQYRLKVLDGAKLLVCVSAGCPKAERSGGGWSILTARRLFLALSGVYLVAARCPRANIVHRLG